jgi:peptide-methionine (S)-S-oxide reductase
MQDLIRRQKGVISTRVGYTGGDVPNATYRNHGTHAEAIEIVFDPAETSYRQLLEFFFQIHDPTTRNRQGNDVGVSYRSAIFYTSEEQKRVAEDTIADVDASGIWPGKAVTEIAPSGDFWEAEPVHQDYLERTPLVTPALHPAGLEAPGAGQGVAESLIVAYLNGDIARRLEQSAMGDRVWPRTAVRNVAGRATPRRPRR